jgi:hypothetical protein
MGKSVVNCFKYCLKKQLRASSALASCSSVRILYYFCPRKYLEVLYFGARVLGLYVYSRAYLFVIFKFKIIQNC